MDKVFTKEQFDEAVKKSLDECVDITLEGDVNVDKAMASFLMGLQNVAFATLIEKNLFGEEPIKEDKTI